jgi:hypothetical protein
MKIITCAFAILYCCSVSGQSFKYRNYNYQWEESHPTAIPVEPMFATADAVILDESVNYNAGGNITPNRFYLAFVYNQFVVRQSSDGLSPIVSKHTRIKYQTQKGIDKYSTFILPESFDRQSDCYSVRYDARDSILRPKGEFECVRYFAARIITPGGKIKEAQVNELTQLEVNRYNKVDRTFYSWIFKVFGLNPGDELEIAYAYEGAYNTDASERIFFHGELAKQNYRLIFHYPSREKYIMQYHNGAEPNDSTMVTHGTPSYTEYIFTRKNLYSSIEETGARPYMELPYVSYYKHNLDFGEINTKTKFVEKALPYPWSFIVFPLVHYQCQSVKDRYSKSDRTTVAINNFLAEEKTKINDTAMVSIMSTIHHTIANEFEYKSDIYSYSGDDPELEHLGKYVERRTMRNQSRFRLYEELFSRLDRDYYKVLFVDKRIAKLHPESFEIVSSVRLGFAAKYKGSLFYFYPKSSRYGYETNELPFYYEDIDVLLIPQHEPYMKQFNEFPDINFQGIKTPFSTENENTRTANALVDVSLDSISMNFDLRLKIAGQFSTLLRPYYLNSDKDTTITSEYYKLITDIADKGTLKTNVISRDKIFPYECAINSSFSAKSRINKSHKNYFSIELKGWFNNVIDKNFSAFDRHLDYYPDFKSTDIHRYMLKFDHPVKLENLNELQTETKNSFGEYSVKVNQRDEKSIFIETVFTLRAEVVKATDAKDVAEIFDAIKKINNASLYIIEQ